MQVILRQTVENLGRPGDIVRVKAGYAHNFLIPQGMALLATDGNIRRVEQDKKRLALKEAKLKAGAEELAKQFQNLTLHFEKKAGVEGVLYGSVTTTEIAEALMEKGLEIDRRDLILPEVIKRIGDFHVRVRLHPEVELEFTIHVQSEDGLAEEALAAQAAEASLASEVEALSVESEAETSEAPEPPAEEEEKAEPSGE
jgi:large subunit ribosomal protein L9